MKVRRLKSKMLLQVHDELIFEVPETEKEEMVPLIQNIMSNALLLSVPLKVDIKMGRNWGEMESQFEPDYNKDELAEKIEGGGA